MIFRSEPFMVVTIPRSKFYEKIFSEWMYVIIGLYHTIAHTCTCVKVLVWYVTPAAETFFFIVIPKPAHLAERRMITADSY